jgi:acetyltransferase-like isoleucine patch superfamily enzyme
MQGNCCRRAGVLAAGNPARVIRPIGEGDRQRYR